MKTRKCTRVLSIKDSDVDQGHREIVNCTDELNDHHSLVLPSSTPDHHVESNLLVTGKTYNVSSVFTGRHQDGHVSPAQISVGYWSECEQQDTRTRFSTPYSEEAIPKELSTVKYPYYKFLEIRKQSFINWTVPFLDPNDLSECGFFHTAFEDCVRCFCCGIGLRNWEREDNPWIEHARWSSSCSYLSLKSGPGFIKSILVFLGLEKEHKEKDRSSSLKETRQDISELQHTDDSLLLQHDAAKFILDENMFNVEQVKVAMTVLSSEKGMQNITKYMLVDTILNQAQLGDSSNVPETWHQISSNNSMVSTCRDNTKKRYLEDEETNKIRMETAKLEDLYTCKICLDQKVSIRFVPCGHLVTCSECSPKLRRCPLCSTFIQNAIQTKL